MSPSAYITVRTTKTGRRYVVRYRLGGRFTALIHAGSFKTRRDAETRRLFVISELAAGRDPRATLSEMGRVQLARTLREDYAAWLESRVDAAPSSVKAWRSAMRAMPGWLMDMPTTSVSWRDVARAFAEIDLKPSTLRDYRGTLAQVFDYVDVEPNPARDRRIKLPREEMVEHNPPPAAHVLLMLERLSERMVLPFVLLEQTGARVEEVAGLPWGDVDVIGNRIRVAKARSKTRRARWLQVHPWLMAHIADLCAPEDRAADRRVFDFTTAGLRSAMDRACRHSGITHYHPHDLRHRRISLWHGQGLPWREIADRVGQSRASVTLDVYAHTMPLEEVSPESWSAALVRSG